MKDLYIKATEQAWAEAEGEPTDAAVEAIYQQRIDQLVDHADMLRKREREEGQ